MVFSLFALLEMKDALHSVINKTKGGCLLANKRKFRSSQKSKDTFDLNASIREKNFWGVDKDNCSFYSFLR